VHPFEPWTLPSGSPRCGRQEAAFDAGEFDAAAARRGRERELLAAQVKLEHELTAGGRRRPRSGESAGCTAVQPAAPDADADQPVDIDRSASSIEPMRRVSSTVVVLIRETGEGLLAGLARSPNAYVARAPAQDNDLREAARLR
jgi:hypothetical protein